MPWDKVGEVSIPQGEAGTLIEFSATDPNGVIFILPSVNEEEPLLWLVVRHGRTRPFDVSRFVYEADWKVYTPSVYISPAYTGVGSAFIGYAVRRKGYPDPVIVESYLFNEP